MKKLFLPILLGLGILSSTNTQCNWKSPVYAIFATASGLIGAKMLKNPEAAMFWFRDHGFGIYPFAGAITFENYARIIQKVIPGGFLVLAAFLALKAYQNRNA